jgi:hypothetical protein
MEYCAGADASISSTEFIILGSIRFAGNFNTKIKLYVIDIASVALMRGASAPRFFGMPTFSRRVDCNWTSVLLGERAN